MKRHNLAAAFVGALVLAFRSSGEPAPSPSNLARMVPGEARAAAMKAAGVFTGHGYRMRDGEWATGLAEGNPSFLQVTLFAGVEYGFAAATASGAAEPAISLFDASGREAKTETCRVTGGSAVRIAPDKSGVYYVRLDLPGKGNADPAEASLVYFYK